MTSQRGEWPPKQQNDVSVSNRRDEQAPGGAVSPTEGRPITEPDMAQALADLRELRALAASQGFELFEFLRQLSEDGTPVLRADVNVCATIGATHNVALYSLSEPVKACLAALRMRDRDTNELISRPDVIRHGETP